MVRKGELHTLSRVVTVGLRYGVNLMARVAEQEGYAAAAAAGGRYVLSEVAKLPRLAELSLQGGGVSTGWARVPTSSAEAILNGLRALGLEVRPYHIDVDAFWRHVDEAGYPRLYAGGTMSSGGAREQKLLEYFVSLDLLRPTAAQVMIDVASEWSVFPRVVTRMTGARVYRQDLAYPPGLDGDRIGGSAAHMPVPDQFADLLVLHNAYEHFEGDADTEFVHEAWRVLRPGGAVCILPLNLAERYYILTDPLVDRRGIVWDPGAAIIEIPMLWHNRFGRFYDIPALARRVVHPAQQAGFQITISWVDNARQVHPSAYLEYALVFTKPSG